MPVRLEKMKKMRPQDDNIPWELYSLHSVKRVSVQNRFLKHPRHVDIEGPPAGSTFIAVSHGNHLVVIVNVETTASSFNAESYKLHDGTVLTFCTDIKQ